MYFICQTLVLRKVAQQHLSSSKLFQDPPGVQEWQGKKVKTRPKNPATNVQPKQLVWSARNWRGAQEGQTQACVPIETESEAWVEADENAILQASLLSETHCAPSVPVPRMRARADMWPDMKPEPVSEIVRAATTAALPSAELTWSASYEKTCVKLPTRAPVVMTRGNALANVELGPAAAI